MRSIAMFIGIGVIVAGSSAAIAQERKTVTVGDINSYSTFASFTEPYRKGLNLGFEEINKAKGGFTFAVKHKDDAGRPADAIRAAEELSSSDGASILMGTFLSSTALAVSEYAQRRKVLFLCVIPISDAIVWQKGNRYTFRLNASTYMQADALAEQAAKLPAKRWATIAPSYEYGTSFVTAFKERLSSRRPDVQWVAEQWPVLGKLDAASSIEALNAAKPEALFNATFAGDLVKFLREGNIKGFFEGKSVVSAITGYPEYLAPLKTETPDGWIVSGYSSEAALGADHEAFKKAYMAKFNEEPGWFSLLGYVSAHVLSQAVAKAGGSDPERLVDLLEKETFDSPIGKFQFRAIDHQATLGFGIGKSAQKGGVGKFVDGTIVNGLQYLPSESATRALRAQ